MLLDKAVMDTIAIGAKELFELMLDVIKKVSPDFVANVESELEELAHCIADISEACLESDISTPEGKILIDMQKQAWQTELLSIEGRTELVAQGLITQAINEVRSYVNGKLGWTLL